LQVGKGVVRRGGKDVALVAYGTMTNSALAAAEMLEKSGVSATVADMRYGLECVLCCSVFHRLCVSNAAVGSRRHQVSGVR
jgi:deoxyxylulose-5-phosphate synthase